VEANDDLTFNEHKAAMWSKITRA